MKIRVFIVLLMVIWDLSLHVVDLFHLTSIYQLYITFPFYGITYDVFWIGYWSIISLILISILFSKKEKIV